MSMTMGNAYLIGCLAEFCVYNFVIGYNKHKELDWLLTESGATFSPETTATLSQLQVMVVEAKGLHRELSRAQKAQEQAEEEQDQ